MTARLHRLLDSVDSALARDDAGDVETMLLSAYAVLVAIIALAVWIVLVTTFRVTRAILVALASPFRRRRDDDDAEWTTTMRRRGKAR